MLINDWLTIIHTLISFVAIISGLLVVKGLISSAGRQLWTVLFLCSAAATTVTGFFFPFQGVTPAFARGVISIVPITLAFMARYSHRLQGRWRGIYVVMTVLTLYFNCFDLVVQMFQKIPSLNVYAPTQTELPFQIAQFGTLILFIVIGLFSLKNYHPKKEEEPAANYISPHPEAE